MHCSALFNKSKKNQIQLNGYNPVKNKSTVQTSIQLETISSNTIATRCEEKVAKYLKLGNTLGVTYLITHTKFGLCRNLSVFINQNLFSNQF